MFKPISIAVGVVGTIGVSYQIKRFHRADQIANRIVAPLQGNAFFSGQHKDNLKKKDEFFFAGSKRVALAYAMQYPKDKQCIIVSTEQNSAKFRNDLDYSKVKIGPKTGCDTVTVQELVSSTKVDDDDLMYLQQSWFWIYFNKAFLERNPGRNPAIN